MCFRVYYGQSMPEAINESVSVALFSNHTTNKILPVRLYWQGRKYHLNTVGLHHTYHVGNVLMHVFSVTDGATFFRLELNAEALTWKLLDIETGS